ncbi:hypothetical protein NC651_007293 [Populus alba x Populus x berolinensis]|nr:hypothetical protein NC651_007293 [Populus alba x Populus x berolinensis]
MMHHSGLGPAPFEAFVKVPNERVLVIKRIWPRKLSLNCSQRMVRAFNLEHAYMFYIQHLGFKAFCHDMCLACVGFFEYCRSVLRDMGGVYLGPERYTRRQCLRHDV